MIWHWAWVPGRLESTEQPQQFKNVSRNFFRFFVSTPRSRPRPGHPPHPGHHRCCCLLVSQVHDKARDWRCCGGSPRGRGRDQGLTLIIVELNFVEIWEGQILYRDPQGLPGSLTSACFSQYGFHMIPHLLFFENGLI